MSKQNYNLHLKGYVGGWDFDADYVDYVLNKNTEGEVHVLIDSLGGSLASALSIVASFRNHGNVHVHYVGMNASAATIASLGAKHVSIDSSAMYLVHKCSMEFFQWASANSDKLRDIIKEAQQMKADLDKMDANVAEMYAKKCKRPCADLLALMKKGGWLTAKEALDWGFVDEITDYEDDAAPVITDLVAADMNAHGIPVPTGFSKDNTSVMTRFIEALTNVFKSNNKPETKMDPNEKPQEPAVNAQASQETVQAESQRLTELQEQIVEMIADHKQTIKTLNAEHESAIKDKDDEIAQLKAQVQQQKSEIEALKQSPGDTTHHVVDDKGSHKGESPIDSFYETVNKAQALFDALP